MALSPSSPSSGRPLTPFLGLIDDDDDLRFDPVLKDLRQRLERDTQLGLDRMRSRARSAGSNRSFDQLNMEIVPRILSSNELQAVHRAMPASFRRSHSSVSITAYEYRERPTSAGALHGHFTPGIMQNERKHAKLKPLRVNAKWNELVTDRPWTDSVPNQIDTRCEAMRHAQKKLPKGNSAAERKAAARRLAKSPLRRPRGLDVYATAEVSRFALANSRPAAHDLLYRTASMPAAATSLDRYYS